MKFCCCLELFRSISFDKLIRKRVTMSLNYSLKHIICLQKYSHLYKSGAKGGGYHNPGRMVSVVWDIVVV